MSALAHLVDVRQWSLRRRLVAGLLLLAALAIVAVGFAAVVLLRGYLVDRVDDQLSRLPGRFGAFSPSGGFGQPPTGSRQLPTPFVQTIVDADGNVVAMAPATTSQDGSTPDVSSFTAQRVAQLDGAIVEIPSTTGRPHYRARARALNDGSGDSVVLAVSLSSVDSTVRRLAALITVVGFVVLLLVGLLGTLVVRAGLRPLEDVEVTAEAIAAGDLTRRVPPGPPGTEVGRLSTSLNGMLHQIEAAFRDREASESRLRRFVADASHELRTPLTTIRGYAELFRQGAVHDPEEQARALDRIETESKRMGLLVDDLLLLARLDQQRPLRSQPVDLAHLAAEAVEDARTADPQRTYALREETEEAIVLGDADRLHQVLANLLTNARQHCPPGTRVDVRLTRTVPEAGGSPPVAWVQVDVTDDGPGLDPEQLGRVFERFYRGDSARTRGGSGLGLSIVSAVVEAHGGQVGASSVLGRGTTFSFRIPAVAEAAPAAEVTEPTPSSQVTPRSDTANTRSDRLPSPP
ncbi:MAG TPA: HAMP domain-containing sensor histidine kinase [Actinomycetes bacterium]|nr:HAMP domain-containing sensor histidine kinase [Actinomycetes bacterium]